jgi:ATP-dependent helicase YprA (DUF1998 family)
MTLDPLATSDAIVTAYQRYLRTLVEPKDSQLAAALEAAIGEAIGDGVTKGPLLEATPPYATGANLADLISEGVLHPGLASLGPGLPLDRPLYRHQEQAVRKAVAGRNLVVATGTGSGKTESFLIPILNRLLAERAAATLTPGVRAILLYPMNALANDQMKRLRGLLADTPEITFGRYTGETRQTRREAAEVFDQQNPGSTRLPNELLSREEMRRRPPHVLLTNYAMLEYLLLRPLDMDLFEGEHAGHWQFIVVDEAHVYDGARGAELAMLLRRLRDRVGGDQPVQCVATSATVGNDAAAVAQFAANLFDVPFEQHHFDPARQDVVTATRVQPPTGAEWGPLPPHAYADLLASTDTTDAILEVARAHGYTGDDAADALAHEQRVRRLKALLAHGPLPLPEVSKALFADGTATAPSTALVALANGTLDATGSPVLSARYHLFARATEGAFSCLGAHGPHVSLARRERCDRCGDAAFEFGTCQRCGTVYLAGMIERLGAHAVFRSRRSRDEQQVWMALATPEAADEDDETLFSDLSATGEPGSLCTGCGVLVTGAAASCPTGTCADTLMRPVRFFRERAVELTSCLACGGRSGRLIRLFEGGNEAAVSVLATALYQRLPVASEPQQQGLPGGGRKLLLFSDSRQAAAYFAPYLEDSYARLQRRRLLYQGALDAGTGGDETRLEDIVYHAARAADRYGIFERRQSRQARERAVALWAQLEVVGLDERNSLEGRGLLSWGMSRDPNWPPPAPLLALDLTSAEAWALIAELVRTIRLQGAVSAQDGVDPRDEAFNPRLGPIYVRGTGAESRRKVLSWLPTRGVNRRLDYLRRVLAQLQRTDDPTRLLEGMWRLLTQGPLAEWLASTTEAGLGQVYQLDSALMTCTPVSAEHPVWQCTLCRKLAPASVRGVCPTMNCAGTLQPWTPPPVEADTDHYRHLYRTMNPFPLRVLEHTAQWTSERAAEIQQQFVRGEVNALSCSTTFELGVDVGELQAVVLRNMPPTTANYVQRAGRAGRRTDSAALVVTYAQRRSHDLSRFVEPDRMIAGEVRAPYIPLANERIDRRHTHSVALAAFFRHHFRSFGTVWRSAGDFFLPGDDGTTASTLVADFLTPVPADVRASLGRVLPPDIQADIGVDTGDWVRQLVDLLESVRVELQQDVEIYEVKRQEAFTARQDDRAARYSRVINTVTKRELLGLLANRNVLPKYGFPVDTVELKLTFADSTAARHLELARDLSTAIYEYAPGAEVVAGGLLWQSAGVYRLPGRELERRYYAICLGCGHYRDSIDRLDQDCPACGTPQQGVPRRYAIPVFGFVAGGRDSRRRPTAAPRRFWHGATYVVSPGAELYDSKVNLPGGTVTARGGARGELIAISDGAIGRGFLICATCGLARPAIHGPVASHQSPLSGRDCGGRFENLSLAHKYQTDVLELAFDGPAVVGLDEALWRTIAYAVVEGAASHLEISRDDIDATLYQNDTGRTVLMLYDTVPGGAGHVQHIAERLPDVLASALRRVRDCECGPETSCYRCLRVFRNERYHEQLRRGAAADVLSRLVGDHTRPANPVLRLALADITLDLKPDRRFLLQETPGEVFEPATAGQLDLYEGRVVLAHRDGATAVGRLWLHRADEGIANAGLQPIKGESLDGDPDGIQVLAVAV